MYSVMLFLVTIAGWIMDLDNVSNWLKDWVPWCWHQPKVTTYTSNFVESTWEKLNPLASSTAPPMHSYATSNSTTPCGVFTGYTAVYRLMFATTMFFIVFGLVMIKVKRSSDPRVQLHKG